MATGLNNYSGLSELGLFFEISYFDTLMVEQKSVLKTRSQDRSFSLLYTTHMVIWAGELQKECEKFYTVLLKND